MFRAIRFPLARLLVLSVCAVSSAGGDEAETQPAWAREAVARLETELVAAHGEAQRERASRGLRQVASFWRAEDGDVETFAALARRHFAGDKPTLDALFARLESNLEQLDGHMLEIQLAFNRQSDLDLGPILPFDEIFAGYGPSAHVIDDFFTNKLAFVVLLNFPLTTLDERLSEGPRWSRRQWAEARLAERFAKRIPAGVQLEVAAASARAAQYIAQYNIWMHHLVTSDGRPFPPGLRLLSHWNLRDEIKASYADPAKGLPPQRAIQRVMERIVDQTIPAIVVDSPHVDWDPFTGEVRPAGERDSDSPPPSGLVVTDAREPDTRYEVILSNFRAERKVDPWSPTAPTLIARLFEEQREIPEERVREMFEQVLSSPLLGRVARLIESRLGRPLEAFDVWYSGFRPRGAYSEAQLDDIVRRRYPTAEAFEQDMPRLLEALGFDPARARELAGAIVVDPARGSGHAWGAGMREAKSHLRTRVGPAGMDYKGFNIAVHEMGHNVEQTISLRDIDHTLLSGVPSTAFTEALAFVFQSRDLELLGLSAPTAPTRALKSLDDFWGAAEISAVALVDMGVWHWMYEHPGANAAELREATMRIARDVWNAHFAPVLGVRDSLLLGIYSHMVSRTLYLPDYPLGHFIAAQIEGQIEKSGDLGAEFERMARIGRVVPDLWMEKAVGSPVGPEALLAATERALSSIEREQPWESSRRSAPGPIPRR